MSVRLSVRDGWCFGVVVVGWSGVGWVGWLNVCIHTLPL